MGNNITYFGETDFRGKRTRFGIRDEDRTKHVYVIGKTGMGKSNLLENMAIQDIQNGHGLAFIDPHGSAVEKLLDYVPEHRIKDVIYFAPFDLDYPISFNVMEDVGRDQRQLVVNGLMSAFKKIWGEESWSDRMAYILTNILLALLEYPGATLLGVNRIIADKEYRNKVVANVTDPSVKSYWLDEYAKYTERFAAEATPAIQNKIGQFTSNPLIRNIIGQSSSINFRQAMDEQKILLVNLSKGRLGEGNANLIGSLLITKIYLAAMSRANLKPSQLAQAPQFYLFVDEFQSFANESFADILSEARKYNLSLTLAHQFVDQMSEEVRDAVFGNVGTTIAFRVGPLDAEIFEKIFNPTFMKEDMVNLGRFQMYLSLMINGVGSTPFSARGIPPLPVPPVSYRDQILESSRRLYARPREKVEEELNKWYSEGSSEGRSSSNRAAPAKSFPAKASVVESPRPKPAPRQTPPPPRPVPPPRPEPDGFVPLTQINKVVAPQNPPEKVVSLKELRPTPNQQKSTGKHSADLRDVLKSVQSESAEALRTAKPEPKPAPKPESVSKAEPPLEKKSEVPEEVLRKMLEL